MTRLLCPHCNAIVREEELVPAPQFLYIGGKYILDLYTNRLTEGVEDVRLTETELKLLTFLAQAPNAVHTYKSIYEGVWGFDADPGLHVHLMKLRRKLGAGVIVTWNCIGLQLKAETSLR